MGVTYRLITPYYNNWYIQVQVQTCASFTYFSSFPCLFSLTLRHVYRVTAHGSALSASHGTAQFAPQALAHSWAKFTDFK